MLTPLAKDWDGEDEYLESFWDDLEIEMYGSVLTTDAYNASQPRHPKGSPKGGQFSSKGFAGLSGANAKKAWSEVQSDFDMDAMLGALKATVSKKYDDEAVIGLLEKSPKDLSHYEKKVVAKYNKTLKVMLEAGPGTDPVAVVKEKAEPVIAVAPVAAVGLGKAPSAYIGDEHLDAKLKEQYAKIATTAYGMKPETLEKLVTGEYEPKGPHQIKALAAAKSMKDTALMVKAFKEENPATAATIQGKARPAPSVGKPAQPAGMSADMAYEAAKLVASPKYNADQIMALTMKSPADLSHYEKKKVAAYNKALKAQQGMPTVVASQAVANAKGTDAFPGIAAVGGGSYPTPSVSKPGKLTPIYEGSTVLTHQPKPLPAGLSSKPPVELSATWTSLKIGGENTSLTFDDAMTRAKFTDTGTLKGKHLHSLVGAKNTKAADLIVGGLPALSSTEISAVKDYTGSGYTAWNRALRNGEDLTQNHYNKTAHMDKAIAKSSLKQDQVFVRGVRQTALKTLVANADGDLKVGSAFQDPGYSSFTTDVGVAAAFSHRHTAGETSPGWFIATKAKAGQRVLPVSHISSVGTGEAEYIPARGSWYKITGIDKASRTIYTELMQE